MKKVIIAHVSKQHSFHTAIALKRQGILHKYVTTVYDKPNSFTDRVKSLLKGNTLKKANSRSCEELEANDVIQFYELLGLLRIFKNRIKFLKPFNIDIITMRLFAKKVANYVIKEQPDAVIVYDGVTKLYLDRIKKKCPNTKIIMDVTICARPFMKDVFEEDMKKFNHEGFYTEEALLWNDKFQKQIIKDFKNTDTFLVPSEVVKKSLLYCDINESKITKVPYGVDVSHFAFKQKSGTSTPLKILFVGNLSYRKGIHHLLNVVSKFSNKEVELNLVGGYNPEGDFYKEYHRTENINFHGFVTRDRISDMFQDTDVFVMPTLSEGLALVILEALATGTPVICTEKAGGNDAIEDYKNGIVLESGNREQLYDAIKWFIDNKDKLPAMSAEAHKTGMTYSWDAYYSNLNKQLTKLI